MDIGRMSERITIEKNTVTVDSVGNHINTWYDYYSCYAYANTYAADEDGEEVKKENGTISFFIRYSPETSILTSTNYRIRHRNRIYNIDSVDLMNFDHQEVRLKCSREVGT